MKASIVITIISLLCSFSTEGQGLKYLKPMKESTDVSTSFHPMDMKSALDLDTKQWKFSLLGEGKNIKSLNDAEKNKFQKESVGCSEEDLEILKTLSISYYIDKDFQVVTFTVRIPMNI